MRRTLLLAAGAMVVVAALFGVYAVGSSGSSGTRAVDGAAANASGAQQAGTALGDQHAQYPWAIRLEHSGEANGRILATHTGFADGQAEDPIFESTDDGETFSRIGTMTPGMSSENLCCTSLFELPKQVGQLPAGTLLWSGSANDKDRPMSLPIWRSDDHGRTWSQLSNCATSPTTRVVSGNRRSPWTIPASSTATSPTSRTPRTARR